MDTHSSTNRRFKKILVNILSIVVILAIAFPVTENVSAQEPNPFFRAFPDVNAIDGGNWPLGATVHMAIDDPATGDDPDYVDNATVVASDEGWISTYVRFNFDGLYDLKPGDEVTLTAGEIGRYQVVPNLQVTTLDVENNIIGGVFEGADAGTTVHVFIGGGSELYVSTDSNGAWVADFDEVGFDLLAGMEGAAEVWFDEFNDSTIFNWNTPWLIAFPENEAVEGWEWPEGATVTLTINNAPGKEWSGTAEVTSWGDPRTYLRLEFWEEYNLQVGDVVTLTDEFGTTITHTVQNLSVTVVNTRTDTVNGTADPGVIVQTWPHEFDQTATVEMIATVNGGWQANFGSVGFDVIEGTGGRSQIVVDGNATAVDWNAYQTYDIYAYNPMTGTIQQLTYLANTDEYNPSWSPNGKNVAHDVVNGNGQVGIYVTNVKTGVSTPLAGAQDGGNDAVWSPNGKWIVFDRAFDEIPSLYLVPATGGIPTLVRDDAVSADWAPNGQRLVFQQPSDGSIWTISVDRGKGDPTFIAASGANPVWSPDGNWIAYENDGDIWKVLVNVQGTVLGDPIQVTGSAFADGQPTWSADSQTIVYHSGFNNDWDLWSIPASGGMPTWLNGAPNFGDYDPAYAKNSAIIAYASISPDGQAPRLWVSAFSYDPPTGTFRGGTHPYHFEFEWSAPGPGSWSGQGGEFSISDAASFDGGYVLLRGPAELRGVDSSNGLVCEGVDEINPNQPTRFLVGWLPDFGEITYSEAKAHFESITAEAVWDDGISAELVRHEVIPFSWDNWFQYVCTFTAP